MVRFFTHIILILLLFSPCLIQQENKITEKQAELNNLKLEIKKLQQELELKQRKEKESFNAVENFSRQGFLLNKLISKIRDEEAAKQKQISLFESEIKEIRREIKRLQDNYAKYVRAVYKHGKLPEWAIILDASSVKQAFLRTEYLRRIAARHKDDVEKLRRNNEKLAESVNLLEAEKKERSRLALQKEEENKTLRKQLNERKKILAAIRTDKKELKKELDAKKNAEGMIKNMIARLVEETERKRREEAVRLAAIEKEKQFVSTGKGNEIIRELNKEVNPEPSSEYDVDLSTASFTSFAAARGRLIWPLSGGKVIRKFGENKNRQLNTITVNNGIDIKAGKDFSVKAVADGVVSAIDWVPGYGSVIILTHKGDYRTVYSHLSEIFVKEGDKIKSGTLIAKTAESAEGHLLHFEIWSSRINQDPELWLSGK